MLEVVAAIGLAAIFSTYLFSALIGLRKAYQDYVTSYNAQVIMRCVANYAVNHGCLPYPAEPGGPGVEIECPEDETEWRNNSAKYTRGVVPYITLGLEERYTKDGYGSKFTYIINPTLGKRKQVISVPIGDVRELLEYRGKERQVELDHNLRWAKVGSSIIQCSPKLYSSFMINRGFLLPHRDNLPKDLPTRTWDITSNINNAELICVEAGQPIKLDRFIHLEPPTNLRYLPSAESPMQLNRLLNNLYVLQANKLDKAYVSGKESEYCVMDCVAIALISHGPSRGGAFAGNSVNIMPNKPSLAKIENGNRCTIKQKFHVSKDPADNGLFDDKVIWVSRFNLPILYSQDAKSSGRQIWVIDIDQLAADNKAENDKYYDESHRKTQEQDEGAHMRVPGERGVR